jgi:ectoine hydroxylase-related dioxygenase (phytanoyl-CoA dioxygenase family)
MAFQVSDRHSAEYRELGYTVLERIIPLPLLRDLRRQSDRARTLARKIHGPQAQRLQPVGRFDINFSPLAELSEFRRAIDKILSPRHTFVSPDSAGILFEPADLPWCTEWHRDWRDNVPGISFAQWESVFGDARYFNQMNAALYEDGCTWVVPGSHARADTPAEVRRFPIRPVPPPILDGKTSEEREQISFDYASSMPGAVRLRLNAGDVALYRNSLWHLGSYVPYQKRATIHDYIDTPDFAAWRDRVLREASERRKLRRVQAAAR